MKLVILAALLAACAPAGDRKSTSNMTEDQPAALSASLVTAGYDGLFLSGDRTADETIWADGRNRQALEDLIAAPATSAHARFLAAELLREHQVSWPASATPLLAQAYAQALASTSDAAGNPWRLNGNAWGFLQYADDAGQLGAPLVGLGDAAVPYLLPLLDDDGPVFYEGSREAMAGNRLQYLIKDFAAYYLGQIRHVDVPLGADRAARDAEIARLRRALATGP